MFERKSQFYFTVSALFVYKHIYFVHSWIIASAKSSSVLNLLKKIARKVKLEDSLGISLAISLPKIVLVLSLITNYLWEFSYVWSIFSVKSISAGYPSSYFSSGYFPIRSISCLTSVRYRWRSIAWLCISMTFVFIIAECLGRLSCNWRALLTDDLCYTGWAEAAGLFMPKRGIGSLAPTISGRGCWLIFI